MKIYLIMINIISFVIFGIDKLKAIKNRYRISERFLFSLALLAGGAGCLAGMIIFRHKIRKPLFFLGIPAIIIAEVYLWGLVV